MKKVLLILSLVLVSVCAHSQIQSNGTGGGNWNNGATWQGGVTPNVGDDVIILAGDVVTLNVVRTIQNLTINSGGALNQNNNNDLTLTGNLTNNGAFTSNESGGDRDVIMMTGVDAILDGSGTFDMNNDGRFEILANTTIAASANLTFFAGGTQENLVRITNNIVVTNNGSVTVEEDITGQNGNSTWINAANSHLAIGDDLMTTGILTANATGNTVEYNESEDVDIKVPTSNQYFNLVLSGGQVKSMTAALTVLGDVTISSTLASGNNNLTVQGNWTNTGNFTEGTGTVTFNGTGNQSITSSVEENFNNLTIDKAASTLTLNSDVMVAGTLDIDNVVISTGSNVLTLGSSTAQTGTLTSTTAATIVGKFKRWVNATATPFNFPVGTSSNHRPVSISFDNLTGGSLTTEFVASTPGSITNPPLDDSGFSLNNLHVNGYWSLIKADGLATTSYDVDITATGFTTFTLDANSRIVSRANSGVDWGIDGTHDGASFSGSTIHRNDLATLSADFAIAEDDACSFPSTSSITGTTNLCINTTGEGYSVTGTAGSTFSWEVIGGTIVGGTGAGTIADPSVRSAVDLTAITVDWGNTGGTGQVQVTEDNSGTGGCGPGDPVVSTITLNPVATSAISGSAMVLSGTTGESYSITNTSGYTYNWSVTGGGNSIASGQTTGNITIDWGTTPGTYTVSVIGEEGTVCSPAEQAAQVDLTVTVFDVIESNGTGGGNWNNVATWAGGIVPGVGDNVRIVSGDAVTLNVNSTIDDLEIQSGATLSQNNNRVLTLIGDFTNNGEFISNESGGDTDVIIMNGATSTLDGTGSFDMNNDGVFEFRSTTIISAAADLTFFASGTQENQVSIDNDIVVTNHGRVSISKDMTGDNANATWINAAGSTLEIGDQLLDQGVLVANTLNNTVDYIGITNDDNVKNPVGGEYYNLRITGSQVKSLTADVTILGDLVISSNLNAAGFDISLMGNWTNTGTYQSSTETVSFISNNTQTLTTTIGEVMNDLTVSKGGGTLTVSGDVQVTGTLEIDNCFINMGSSTLTLGSSTASVGTLSRLAPATIAGKFERWINATGTPILFPLGTSSNYNPVEITFNNLTNGSLVGEFIPSNPGAITNPPLDDAGTNINNTYLEGYWSLERANSLVSSDYDLTLRGEGFSSFTITNATRILTRTSQAADWSLTGTHVSAPFTFPVVARDNMAVLSGEFTLAESNACSFPSTSAITGNTDVCINTTGEIYSATGTAGSTFSWEVIGGTIVGGTGAGTMADPSVRSAVDLTSVTVDWGSTGGTGQVQVTEDNTATGGCGLGEPVLSSVTLNPVPTSVITGSSTVLSGASGEAYSVTNTTGYTYNWSVTGGGNSVASGQTTDAITINWGTTPGTFTVSVIAEEGTICSPAEQAAQVELTVNVVDVIESNGTGGGNWNNAATWVGGIVPNTGDNVRIVGGDNVTLNVTRTINNLEIQSGAILTQNNNNVITLTGNLTHNGTFDSNESGGDVNVFLMNGTNAILDGTGTFDMGNDGVFEFLNTTTIAVTANLTFLASGTQENLLSIDNDIVITNNGTVTVTQDMTGDNANATWINASGATLNIGDELLNTGILVANAPNNTVNYTGIDNNDFVKDPSGSEYYNLSITGSQVKSLTADVTILGDMLISSNLNSASFNIILDGNWTNSGVYQSTTETVTFRSATTQSLTTVTGETFNNLSVTKGGGTLNISGDVQVTGTLDIDNCFINMGTNTLTLGTSTASVGTLVRAAPATIAGKFERWINATGTPILFPLGTAGNYNPVEITFNSLTNGSLIGEFIPSNPGAITNPPLDDSGVPINNTYLEGYWSLERANSLTSSDYNLSLRGEGFSSFTISDITRILVRTSSSADWSLDGTHVSSPFSFPVAVRNNMSTLSGEFTLAENNSCSFPSTSAITGNTDLCINTTGESYSVTGTAGSTFSWEVVGGTIAGGTGTGTVADPSVRSGVDLTSVTVDWGSTGGSGQVQVTENNSAVGGCGDGVPVTATINLNPVLTSVITGSVTVPANATGVSYSVDNNAGYSYTWSVTGGGNSVASGQGTNAATLDWGAVAGTFTVSVVAEEGTICSPAQQAPQVDLTVTVVDVIESNGTGGGNWNNAATWVGGIVPNTGDNVRIVTGDNVTLNVTRTINSLEIESGATLTQNNNNVITLTGNLTNNGAFVSNESGGDTNVFLMSGTNAILDGIGSFDMGNDGVFEFLNTTTIAASANLTFFANGSQENLLSIDNDIVITNNGTISVSQDLTGDNANATWINAAGSTLEIGDELLNTGVLIASANNNTVNYIGIDNNDNIKNPQGGQYYNLSITGSQVKFMISDLTVLNDLVISSTLNAAAFTLTVQGDWTNTGSFVEATSSVIFDGTADQTLTSATDEIFNNLTVSKGGSTLIMSANVEVDGTLTIENSMINAQTNTLTLGSGVSQLGTLTRIAPATIIGKFERWVNVANQSNLLFPIGSATTYNPMVVTFNNLNPGSLIAEFINSTPGPLTSPPLNDNGFDLNNTYNEGYWTLTRANSLSSSDYNLELTGDGFNSFTPTVDTRMVTRLNSSSNWSVDGTHNSTGFVSPTIKRDNLTLLSAEYALAENDNCSFPNTSAIGGDITACVNETGLNYTVSGTAGSTFTWSITGGTFQGTSAGVDVTSVTVDWGATGGTGQLQVIEDNSATGGCGAGTPVTLDVTLNPVPISGITGTTTVGTNQTGQVYTITTSAGHTYDWDITGGVITAPADPDNDVTGSITVDWGGTAGIGQISVSGTEGTECAPPVSTSPVTLNVDILDVIISNGTGGGNWNNAATWIGGVVPNTGNNVRIVNGDNVTLNVTRTISNLEIESGATLTQNNNNVLTLTGDLTNNGAFVSNESGGDTNVLLMNGTNAVLSGTGTFDMGNDGVMEFLNTTSISSDADLTYFASGTQENLLSIDNDIVITNNGTVTVTQDMTGDNANATWINASGATLNIGDELLNTGILIANATNNTVNYNGIDNNDNIKAPSSNEYYNLQITGGQVKNVISNLSILNDLTISSTLNAAAFTISVGGNWTNTGSFTEGSSTVQFTGSGDQNFTSSIAEDFNNLTINKTGGTLIVNNDIAVASALSLDAGTVNMGANTLTLGSSTASLGSISHTAPARIVGKFRRWVNTGNQTGLELPIGTLSDLAEATLTFNNLTAGAIIAEFIASDPGSNGLSLDDNGTTVFNTFFEGYWALTTDNGLLSNDYDVTLEAGGFTSFDVSTSRVLTRSNSSNPWTADGTHVAAVSTTAQRSNITTLSAELALGDITNCPDPGTNAITGDVSVCINEGTVSYTATGGLAGSTYTWTVAGGTVDGGVSTGVGLTSINVNWGATGGAGSVSVVENNDFDPVFGCGAGAPVVLDVTINPVPLSAISGTTTAITNQSGLTYTITASAGYTYDWDITGGTITAPADPNNDVTGSITVTWGAAAGTGQISVTGTENVECAAPEATAPVSLDVSLLDVIVSNGTGGGNWNNAATWVGGVVPNTGNNVRIASGDNVTLNVTRTINSLEIESGATLVQNNNQVLTLTGNLTNNGAFESNESGGDTNVFLMNGSNAVLDGSGTFDMGNDGVFEFLNTTSIAAGANLTFFATGTQENMVSIDNDIVITNNGTVTITQDMTGDNANATWVNAAGSVLNIGDELLNTGILIANSPGNTVNYNGIDNNDDIKQPSGNEYYNLQITGGQIKSAVSDLTVLGDITISSTLNAATFTINVEGNWTNTGSLTEATSTIIFSGSADQTITSTGGETFFNMQTSKSSGTLILANDVDVINTLTMNEGNINVQSSQFTLGTNAITEGTLTHVSGIIIGAFDRWVNSATSFLFPIGTTTDYLPVTISFDVVSSGGRLRSTFNALAPGSMGLPFDDSGFTIQNAFTEGYWTLTMPSAIGFTTYDIDLTGNGFVSFTVDTDTRVISRDNSSVDWVGNGTHVAATGVTAQRDNIATLPLDFAFADDTNCTPSSTSAITRAVAGDNCANQAGVVYQVTNTPGSTYTWTVDGGIITNGQGENAITITWGAVGDTYTISVTEDNSGAGGCGIGTPVTLDVDVNPLPTGPIVGSISAAEGTTGVVYTVSSRTGYTYDWAIDDEINNTLTEDGSGTATIDWGNVSGTFTVSVVATNTVCGLSANAVTLDVNVFEVIESNGIGGGNWSSGATWVGGAVPQSTNSVRIVGNDIVTLNVDRTINNIIITTNATVAQNNNRILTIDGNFTNDGTFDSNETGGDNNVVLMNGSGAVLDGTGTFDMGTSGVLEFLNTTTIASTAVLTFTGTQENQVSIDNDIVVTNNGSVTITQDLTGDNANSTWVNAAGSTLIIGDELLNTGILDAGQTGNTIEYNEPGNSNIKTALNSEYYNLIISGTNTKSLTADISILGDLTISSTLNSSNFDLFIGGNWNNTGAFTEGTSTVTFNGTADQSLTNASGETFSGMTVNKSGGSLVLVNNVDATTALSLILGTVDTETNGTTLTLGTNAPSSGTLTRTSGYVVGNFRRWIPAGSTGIEFLFPVGTTTDYRPLEMTFDAITSGGSVTALFNSSAPGNGTTLPIVDGAETVSNAFTEGFWSALALDGFVTSQYDVDITGNGFSSFAFDPGGATRMIVRSNGATDWISPIPGVHVNGSGNEVQRDNITTSLDVDFTVGDITGCPTINTSAITGDTEVCNNETGVTYSVVDEGSTYNWSVTGGTIASGNGTSSITVDWGATGGEFTVQVQENNGCATGTAVTLDVNVNPIPAGSISGNFGVAEGAIGETYSIVNRTGYSYQWSTSDGSIVGPSTNSTVTIDWTGTGTGTLTLTVTYDDAVAVCGAPTGDEVINETITFFTEFETTQSGDFDTPGTWVCNCVPNSNSDIVVRTGHTVTTTSGKTMRDVTIEAGATYDNNGFGLIINNNFVLDGTHTGLGNTIMRGTSSNISGIGNKDNGLLRLGHGGTTSILASSNLTFNNVIVSAGTDLANLGTVSFSELNSATGSLINQSTGILSIQAASTSIRIESNSVGSIVRYNGGTQSIKSPSGSPSAYYDLQILGSGTKSLPSDLAVGNDLTINGGAVFLGANTLRVGGDWNNQSNTFNEGTGTVIFNGSGAQTITNSSGLETFTNVEINSTHGGQGVVPTSGTTINITGQLTFTDGYISSTTSEPLVLGSSATIVGGSNASYVKGPLTHTVAATGPVNRNFPVGDGSNRFKRAELDITQDAATATQYTINFIQTDANTLAVSTSQPLPDIGADIQDVSTTGYWDITKGAGANLTNADLTLHYTVDDGVADFNNLIIAKADDETAASTWAKVGEGGSQNIAGTITATGLTSFSIVALGNNTSGSNPLPVTLFSFTGRTVGNDNYLTWITASELNNDYFELQRSADGINYETITRIEGQGTTEQRTEYNYIDQNPLTGLNYYRLKQVDIDGAVTIFNNQDLIVVLEVVTQQVSLSMKAFPNPTTEGDINVKIEANQGRPILLQMYDLFGKVVYQKVFAIDELAKPIKIKPNETLRKGVYIVTVEQGGKKINKKLIITQ